MAKQRPVKHARRPKTRRRDPIPPPAPTGGRPRGEPVTELGRWLARKGMTCRELAERIAEVAAELRIPKAYIPQPKTLGDAISGRHCPGPTPMLLIRTVTGGEVDLPHWVDEILSRS